MSKQLFGFIWSPDRVEKCATPEEFKLYADLCCWKTEIPVIAATEEQVKHAVRRFWDGVAKSSSVYLPGKAEPAIALVADA